MQIANIPFEVKVSTNNDEDIVRICQTAIPDQGFIVGLYVDPDDKPGGLVIIPFDEVMEMGKVVDGVPNEEDVEREDWYVNVKNTEGEETYYFTDFLIFIKP